MFEGDDHIVKVLLDGGSGFRTLYEEHSHLKRQVHESEIGVHPLDDLALVKLKKEKLLAKDKMAHIILRTRKKESERATI